MKLMSVDIDVPLSVRVCCSHYFRYKIIQSAHLYFRFYCKTPLFVW